MLHSAVRILLNGTRVLPFMFYGSLLTTDFIILLSVNLIHFLQYSVLLLVKSSLPCHAVLAFNYAFIQANPMQTFNQLV
jgi:hypothetical protein